MPSRSTPRPLERGSTRPPSSPTCSTLLLLVGLTLAACAPEIDPEATEKLHAAVKFGTLAEVELALDTGASIDAPGVGEWPPIHFAVNRFERNPEIVDLLIERGARIDLVGGDGMTLLHVAAGRGDVGYTALLLSLGIDPAIEAPDGTTPLHLAIQRGKIDAARMLLDAGAPADGDGVAIPPIHYAAARNDPAGLELLIDYGADLEHRASRNIRPMHLVASKGADDAARLLLERGAKTEALTSDGLTPLMIAVMLGDRAMAELLIEGGADTSATDSDERSIVEIARASGREDLADWLTSRTQPPKTAPSP